MDWVDFARRSDELGRFGTPLVDVTVTASPSYNSDATVCPRLSYSVYVIGRFTADPSVPSTPALTATGRFRQS